MELFCFPKMYGGESGAWLWRGRGAPRHLLLPPLLLCTDGRPSPSPSLPPPRAIAVKPFHPNPGVQENLSFPFPSLPEQALGADGDGWQASPPLKHPRKKKPARTGGIEGNQQKPSSESVADKEIIGGGTFAPASNPGSKQKQPRKKYGRRSGAVIDSSTEEQQCVMRGLAEMAQRSSVVVVSDWSAEEEFQLTLASPPPRLQDGKSAVLAGEESPPGSPPQELWPQKKKKERRKKVGLDLVNQSSLMSPPKSQNLVRNPEEQLDSHPNSSVSNRFCAILAEEESLPGSSPQEVWPQKKKKGRRKAGIDLVNQISLMSPPKSQNLVKNREEQADSRPNSSFSDSFCAILAEEESLPELWIEKKKGRTKKAGIDLVNQSSLTSPPKSQNLARNPEKQSDFHPNSSVSDSFGAILGEDGSLPRSSEELWIEKKEGRRKESGIDSVNRSSLTSLSESKNLARNWEEHSDFHPNSSISDSFCAILAEEKNLSRSLKQLQPEKKGRMKEAGIDSVNKSPLMSLPKSQNLARNREKQQDFGPNCSIINSVCNILAGEKSPPGGLSLTASLLHRQNLARNPEVQQQKQQTQSLSVNPNNSPPENPSPLQTKTGTRKKKKEFSPLQLFTKELDMCAMEGNVLRSLELFDKAVREGGNLLKLGVRQYNAILYLCSSAASGTVKMRSIVTEEEKNKTRQNSINNDENSSDNGENSIDNGEEKTILSANGARDLKEVAVKPEVMAISLKRGYVVYRHMLEEGVEPNEATFTAMARLAMSKGDGDLAFEMVKKISENNTNPRLRSYDPALFTYCKNGQVEKAFEVLSHMLMSGLEPEEAELAALLKVSVETGQEDKVYSTLHRLRKATREFSVDTVKVIEEWFRSEVASLAIKKKRGEVGLPSMDMIRSAIEANGGGSHGLGWLGTGKWKVERTDISEKGVCLCCGEQLSLIDIDPLETKKFAESLELLACEKELKSDQFKLFQSWLNKQQHYHAVVDGANVGLFNQKNAHTLNIHQLNSVVTQLQMMDPEKRLPLVILHNRRTKNSKLLSSHAQAILDKWSEANALYATPTGSNDDWYWLYAAVKCKCLLVTNDEMRDHLFQLLGNNFFPKWKERHQVRLSDQNGRLCLHMPPPYSIVMQESEKGSWHVPQLGGDDIFAPREWLCVTTDESIESEILSNATIPDCTQNPSKKDSMRTKSTFKTSPKTTRRRIKKPKSVFAVLAKLEAAEEQCGVSIDFQI